MKKIIIKNTKLEKIFKWIAICLAIITMFLPLGDTANNPLIGKILGNFVILSSVVFVFTILDIVSINRVKNLKKPSILYVYRFAYLMLGLIIGVVVSGMFSLKNGQTGCSVGFCGFGETIINLMSGFIITVNFMYLSSCVIADRIYMSSANDKLASKNNTKSL